jgi:hypothetical protein
MFSSRLLTDQQMDEEKPECIPSNPAKDRQTKRMHAIHQVRHTIGVQ